MWGEILSPSIKIFLSYHKDTDRVKSDILTPIHVGRAIASDKTTASLSDMIGDDTGDNISCKNASFCELTAQYWVWKNTDYDYVGFFHYRRHLCFNKLNTDGENKWGVIEYPYITEDYKTRVGLDDETICKAVEGNPLISVTPWDVRAAGSRNNYEHYSKSSPYLHIADFDKAIEILLKNHPDYEEDVKSYYDSHLGYYTNIFIMNRQVFNEYCELMFNTLFELESTIDMDSYNVQEKRVFGYISEWIFGIFLTHYMRVNNIFVPCYSRTYIKNTELDCGWHDIISACDDNYARHLGVLIESVLVNNDEEKIRYWILSNKISEFNKSKLMSMATDRLQIVIVNADDSGMDFAQSSLYTNAHLSISAYLRLLIARYVHVDVHRILYLDCDMICRGSLHELLEMPFNNMSVLGVCDILSECNMKRLGLNKYINSGLLCINLDKWRFNNYENILCQYVIDNCDNPDRLYYHDQDTINYVLNDDIGYIDVKWNAQTSSYDSPEQHAMNEMAKNAVIIHFISDRKPWKKGSNSPFFSEYQKYFKMSPWSSDEIISDKGPSLIVNIHRKISVIGDKVSNRSLSLAIAVYGLNYKLGYKQDLIKMYEVYFRYGKEPRKQILGALCTLGQNGNADAMLRMARANKDGFGVDRDLIQSFRWFIRTIDSGAVWAEKELYTVLPDIYDLTYHEEGSDLSAEAFKYIVRMADSTGSVDAMVRVAK